MKHHSKLVILGLAATLVMTSLTGCLHRKKTTYQTYMQNVLDVNYKGDRKSTRLNSSHQPQSRMPSSA